MSKHKPKLPVAWVIKAPGLPPTKVRLLSESKTLRCVRYDNGSIQNIPTQYVHMHKGMAMCESDRLLCEMRSLLTG